MIVFSDVWHVDVLDEQWIAWCVRGGHGRNHIRRRFLVLLLTSLRPERLR